MHTKNIGLVAAACVVTISVAACGSSSGKSASAAGSSSTSSATATTASASAPDTPTAATSAATTPSTTESSPAPFSDAQLLDALSAPSAWGSGWTHAKDWPITGNSLPGGVDQLPTLDCWAVLNGEGAKIGSMEAAADLALGTNDDSGHQGAYQFDNGDATTSMSELAKKVDSCGTFTHTPKDNSTTFTDKASEKPVSGLGDEAIKTTVYDDSPMWGKDVSVELDVRYGDVVVSVLFDSSNYSRALNYDLAAKVKAIAAKLELKPTGT